MSKKLMLCLALIVPMIIGMMSVGIGQAAFRVENTGQIVYYSNVLCVFSYTFIDTANIVVLHGPHMYLDKYVRNEVTGDTSGNQIPASRGDTVTIILVAANDVEASLGNALADTAAWHVFIYDTFTEFAAVAGGQTAKVGSNDGVVDGGDSFTYVPGSETVNYEVSPESVVLPSSVTYLVEDAGGPGDHQWIGTFNPATQTFAGTWYDYSAKDENNATGDTPKKILGIKWYWRYVPSKEYYDQASESMASTGKPYITQVKFQVKKNNN